MSELNVKIKLQAFDKVSKQFDKINKSGGKLARQFGGNLAQLKKINTQMRDVSGYKKQADAVRTTNQKLSDLQQKTKQLQIALKNSAGTNQSATQIKKLRSEYHRARTAADKLSQTQVLQRGRLADAASALKKSGISTKNLSATQGQLRAKANSLNQSLETQAQKLDKITEKQKHLNKMRDLRDKRLAVSANASMAGYIGVNAARQTAHGLAAPVMEYMRQEDASTDLEITMMRSDGSSGEFDKINEKVKRLGAILPGTTEDFIRLDEALKKQGLKDNILLNGGLENAAKLNVLMNMGKEEGGTFTARMIEAHGLNEKELGNAADLTQRAYYAYGLKKENMAEAMKYYAPRVNTLGLTGEGNYKKLLAIQGMAARKGLEGSMFGTNFSMMLGKLAEGPLAIDLAKKGLKGEAQGILKEAGVAFDFFKKDGSLKSIEGIVKEMGKFDIIRKKLGDKEMMIAMRQMFGEQGGRVAQIIAQGGTEGLKQAMQDMDLQADFDSRIEKKTSTLSATFEQLGGTLTLLQGIFGSLLREDLKELADWATDFIDSKLKPWIKENKTLVKGLMLAVAAFAALAAIGGGLLLVFAGLNSAMTMACWIVKGLPTMFMTVGRAMLANPLLLAITLLATAAYLIYENWDDIAAFFTDLWNNVTATFSQAWQRIKNTVANSAIGQAFKSAWSGATKWGRETWDLLQTDTTAGLAKIGAAILNWSPLGLFYQAFAGVMNYFGVEMPDSLTGFMAETGEKVKNAILNWTPVQWFTDIFSGAFSWIDGKLQGMVNLFTSIKNKITNFFGSADSQMEKLSKSTTDNLKKLQEKNQQAAFTQLYKAGNAPRIAKQQAILNEQIKKANKAGDTVMVDALKRMSTDLKTKGRIGSKPQTNNKTTQITNHININGGGNARQTASAVSHAVGNASLYDGVA